LLRVARFRYKALLQSRVAGCGRIDGRKALVKRTISVLVKRFYLVVEFS